MSEAEGISKRLTILSLRAFSYEQGGADRKPCREVWGGGAGSMSEHTAHTTPSSRQRHSGRDGPGRRSRNPAGASHSTVARRATGLVSHGRRACAEPGQLEPYRRPISRCRRLACVSARLGAGCGACSPQLAARASWPAFCGPFASRACAPLATRPQLACAPRLARRSSATCGTWHAAHCNRLAQAQRPRRIARCRLPHRRHRAHRTASASL